MQNIIILMLACFTFYSCSQKANPVEEIDQHYREGRFSEAAHLINSLQTTKNQPAAMADLMILQERMNRIRLDFSKNEAEIMKELLHCFPGLTREQLHEWEKSGKLEMRLIDNNKMYFRNAVPNLLRVDSMTRMNCQSENFKDYDSSGIKFEKIAESVVMQYRQQYPEILPARKFQIDYTITLKPDAVPAGETIKCWMPFPRKSLSRQNNIKLLSVNQPDYLIAGDSALQRSIYLEKTAVAGKPTVFNFKAEFETRPKWVDPTRIKAEPYNTNSALFRKYTAERPPHLIFSEQIKSLAGKITRDITSPHEKVKAIYYWINRHIPWASALEYSTFECIPQYVLDNRKGDCGMQTLLFMSLARYCGIPCKWQSGWMLHPGEVNLHDWCEVYYEGTGWVPLDQSFGLQESCDPATREFYITGIDSYRLIVNDDFSCDFIPPKQHYRSEPIDFQRGELEWNGGNLYFDKWSYNMNVKYLNQP